MVTGTAHCERRYETDIKSSEGNKPNQHRQLTSPEPTTSNEEKKQVSMCPCTAVFPRRMPPYSHAEIPFKFHHLNTGGPAIW
jgi:hypothetical protein